MLITREQFKEVITVLESNKSRTILTAFGVFWGILILVLLLSLTKGLKNGVESDFENFATNSMFIWGQNTSIPYEGFNKDRKIFFNTTDVDILKNTIPNLKYVSPRNRQRRIQNGYNTRYKNNNGSYDIYGDYPEYINQESINILAGRFINYSDIKSKKKIAIVGVEIIRELSSQLNLNEIIGSYINVTGVNYLIVGIFSNNSSEGNIEENGNFIFLPFTTFSQVYNRGDKVDWMAITAEDEYSITDIKTAIFSTIQASHRISPNDFRAIGHRDLAIPFKRITGLFNILNFVSYFVGALVIFSGIIGVSNIMLVTIKERTKEIGIKRALGATPFQIIAQIIQESLLITLFSGMVGIAVSAFLIFLMNYTLNQIGEVSNFANPSVNLSSIIFALLLLVTCGTLAGLIPAKKAIRIKPIEALSSY